MQSQKAIKRRVDLLFVVHSGVALLCGLLAVLLPHVFEWFLVHHGERLAIRDNSGGTQKIEHLTIRIYGCLILGQVSEQVAAPLR